MRVAIVDDLTEDRNLLRAQIETALNQLSIHADIFEFVSGEDFLSAAQKESFTVSFLDIYMKGITGIDAATQLRTFDKNSLVIFTTTSTDHALEGFRVRALHYLVKPCDQKSISALMDEILTRIPEPDPYIIIKSDGSDIRLRLQDIIYAEHFSHRIYIHTTNGRVLSTRQSFGKFILPLKKHSAFFQCSRGVIVNMAHASDFDGIAFIMNTKETVAVSRDLIKSARQTFMNFLFQRGPSPC